MVLKSTTSYSHNKKLRFFIEKKTMEGRAADNCVVCHGTRSSSRILLPLRCCNFRQFMCYKCIREWADAKDEPNCPSCRNVDIYREDTLAILRMGISYIVADEDKKRYNVVNSVLNNTLTALRDLSDTKIGQLVVNNWSVPRQLSDRVLRKKQILLSKRTSEFSNRLNIVRELMLDLRNDHRAIASSKFKVEMYNRALVSRRRGDDSDEDVSDDPGMVV